MYFFHNKNRIIFLDCIMVLYESTSLTGSSAQIHNLNTILRKQANKSKPKDISQYNWPLLFWNAKVKKNQERLRTFQIKGEQGDKTNTTYDSVLHPKSKEKKCHRRHFGDTNNILNNAIISILDNCNVFMLSSFSMVMALGECPCS